MHLHFTYVAQLLGAISQRPGEDSIWQVERSQPLAIGADCVVVFCFCRAWDVAPAKSMPSVHSGLGDRHMVQEAAYAFSAMISGRRCTGCRIALSTWACTLIVQVNCRTSLLQPQRRVATTTCWAMHTIGSVGKKKKKCSRLHSPCVDRSSSSVRCSCVLVEEFTKLLVSCDAHVHFQAHYRARLMRHLEQAGISLWVTEFAKE